MGSIVKQGAAGTQPWVTQGSQVTALATYTAKTAVGVLATVPCAGFPFLGVSFIPFGTVAGGGSVGLETSSDNGSSWSVPTAVQFATAGGAAGGITAAGFAVATTGQQVFALALPGTTHFRIRLTAVMSGAGGMQVQMGASSAGARPDVYVTGFAATINTSLIQVAALTVSATTLAIQASQTSAVVNGTTTRTTTTGLAIYKSLNFLLNITGAGAVTGVMQIFCEDSQDGGTTWDDLWSSNTFTFGASVTTQRFFVQGAIVPSFTSGSAQAIEALTAGTTRQGPFGDRVRIREVISGVSGGPTGATYRVDAIPHL